MRGRSVAAARVFFFEVGVVSWIFSSAVLAVVAVVGGVVLAAAIIGPAIYVMAVGIEAWKWLRGAG